MYKICTSDLSKQHSEKPKMSLTELLNISQKEIEKHVDVEWPILINRWLWIEMKSLLQNNPDCKLLVLGQPGTSKTLSTKKCAQSMGLVSHLKIEF